MFELVEEPEHEIAFEHTVEHILSEIVHKNDNETDTGPKEVMIHPLGSFIIRRLRSGLRKLYLIGEYIDPGTPDEFQRYYSELITASSEFGASTSKYFPQNREGERRLCCRMATPYLHKL